MQSIAALISFWPAIIVALSSCWLGLHGSLQSFLPGVMATSSFSRLTGRCSIIWSFPQYNNPTIQCNSIQPTPDTSCHELLTEHRVHTDNGIISFHADQYSSTVVCLFIAMETCFKSHCLAMDTSATLLWL